MANPYINIYKFDEATQAYSKAVSTGNSFTEPIQCTLDAEQNESKTIPLAIRTETGYTAPNVSITAYGGSRFTLSKDNISFDATIAFDNVGTTNQIFYALATSQDTEQPQTDRRTKFRFSGKLKVAS